MEKPPRSLCSAPPFVGGCRALLAEATRHACTDGVVVGCALAVRAAHVHADRENGGRHKLCREPVRDRSARPQRVRCAGGRASVWANRDVYRARVNDVWLTGDAGLPWGCRMVTEPYVVPEFESSTARLHAIYKPGGEVFATGMFFLFKMTVSPEYWTVRFLRSFTQHCMYAASTCKTKAKYVV